MRRVFGLWLSWEGSWTEGNLPSVLLEWCSWRQRWTAGRTGPRSERGNRTQNVTEQCKCQHLSHRPILVQPPPFQTIWGKLAPWPHRKSTLREENQLLRKAMSVSGQNFWTVVSGRRPWWLRTLMHSSFTVQQSHKPRQIISPLSVPIPLLWNRNHGTASVTIIVKVKWFYTLEYNGQHRTTVIIVTVVVGECTHISDVNMEHCTDVRR